MQARRRQRVVRVALVSAVALGLLHYLSVQVQLRSCHRDAAAAPSAAAAAQQSVGLDGAQQPASSGGDWSAAGSAGRQQRIPRILHQSWKDANVPARFHKWQVGRSPDTRPACQCVTNAAAGYSRHHNITCKPTHLPPVPRAAAGRYTRQNTDPVCTDPACLYQWSAGMRLEHDKGSNLVSWNLQG